MTHKVVLYTSVARDEYPMKVHMFVIFPFPFFYNIFYVASSQKLIEIYLYYTFYVFIK